MGPPTIYFSTVSSLLQAEVLMGRFGWHILTLPSWAAALDPAPPVLVLDLHRPGSFFPFLRWGDRPWTEGTVIQSQLLPTSAPQWHPAGMEARFPSLVAAMRYAGNSLARLLSSDEGGLVANFNHGNLTIRYAKLCR